MIINAHVLQFSIPCPPLPPEGWTEEAIAEVERLAAAAARSELLKRLAP